MVQTTGPTFVNLVNLSGPCSESITPLRQPPMVFPSIARSIGGFVPRSEARRRRSPAILADFGKRVGHSARDGCDGVSDARRRGLHRERRCTRNGRQCGATPRREVNALGRASGNRWQTSQKYQHPANAAPLSSRLAGTGRVSAQAMDANRCAGGAAARRRADGQSQSARRSSDLDIPCGAQSRAICGSRGISHAPPIRS